MIYPKRVKKLCYFNDSKSKEEIVFEQARKGGE